MDNVQKHNICLNTTICKLIVQYIQHFATSIHLNTFRTLKVLHENDSQKYLRHDYNIRILCTKPDCDHTSRVHSQLRVAHVHVCFIIAPVYYFSSHITCSVGLKKNLITRIRCILAVIFRISLSKLYNKRNVALRIFRTHNSHPYMYTRTIPP
jgi:hypothetical protein